MLSPKNESKEGREKLRRREKAQKAGKLSESWKLLKECQKFLTENSGVWQARTKEETARIREEEKLERFEMIKLKKKKAQRACLTREETKNLKGRTENLLEMGEMQQNLWRSYREDGKMICPACRKTQRHPACIKTITEFIEMEKRIG